jgi:hypothetical protein
MNVEQIVASIVRLERETAVLTEARKSEKDEDEKEFMKQQILQNKRQLSDLQAQALKEKEQTLEREKQQTLNLISSKAAAPSTGNFI